MKDINYNLKPNEMLLGEDVNTELRSIHENFREVASGAVAKSVKVVTVAINENTDALDGSTFIPPITSEPYDVKTVKIEDDGSVTFYELVQNCVKNGDYYDVILMPSGSELTNIKITVLW